MIPQKMSYEFAGRLPRRKRIFLPSLLTLLSALRQNAAEKASGQSIRVQGVNCIVIRPRYGMEMYPEHRKKECAKKLRQGTR